MMAFSSWIRNWKRSIERRWTLYQGLLRKSVARRSAFRPRLEALEDRWLLSAYSVSSAADSGAGTLRDAINQVNAAGSTITEIDFHIGTSGTAQTINLTSQLPTLTASGVFINGLSQGGSSNTTQLITLNGSGAGSTSDGLLLTGSDCIVSGLIIESFGGNGIEVDGAGATIGGTTAGAGNVISGNTGDGVFIESGISGVQVQGNYIGTDATGTHMLSNSGNGIEVVGNNNTIGGTTSGARNIISGNYLDGVEIDSPASGVVVQGNYIGTDVTGAKAVANNYGVFVSGSNNTIGGTATGAGNVISGNTLGDGVYIGASGVTVQGNYIGTDVTGAKAVANGAGVVVAANNTLGGTAAGAGNVISGNSRGGVFIGRNDSGVAVQGNYIGTNAAGSAALANSVGIEVFGSNNTIGGTTSGARNVISGNSSDGVFIDGRVSGVQVQGNYIGTDATGTNAVTKPWETGYGVYVSGSNNTIGGTSSAARNIISGNSEGVYIGASVSGVQVQGNYIGTDVTGTNALSNLAGIVVYGSNVTIGGTTSGAGNLISGNDDAADGVLIFGSGVQVQGNYIGTDATGANLLGNNYGVVIVGSSNTIGGTSAAARNIISGNLDFGVYIDSSASGVAVQGNYIGTDVTGTKRDYNDIGVEVAGPNNTIGGTTTGASNLISGNIHYGVYIDTSASGVQVQGNYVGTDATGTKALTNYYGIYVAGPNSTIGGTMSAARNIIAGYGVYGYPSYGVQINASGVQVQGNYIGTDATGANPLDNNGNGIDIDGDNNTVGGTATGAGNIIANSKNGVLVSAGAGNTITQNSIFANTGLGISLTSGANNNIVAPTIRSAAIRGTTLTVQGSFTAATANVPHVLEFFANPSGDAEGKEFLGSLTVTSANATAQSFTFTTTTTVTGTYPLITATLTDNSGDTSPFSNSVIPASNYVVDSTADDGSAGTLRDAINQVNAGKCSEIDFNLAGTGVQTINLTSALPALTASGVFINGQSENQFQGVTSTSPLVELNGSGVGSSSDGLLLQGSNCIVSGLILSHFTNGIEVDGANNTIGGTATGAGNIISGNTKDGLLIDSSASGVTVQGNYIGTNIAGSAALANRVGIEVAGSNNAIGGTISGARNVISGNSNDGVLIDSGVSGVLLLGNYIGTDLTGSKAIANGIGVEVAGSNNTIGSSLGAVAAHNVISGNTGDGVLIDSTVSGVLVQGNYIGTAFLGTAALGNKNGVEVAGNNNTIGTSYAVAPNQISGNSNAGVLLDNGASGNQVLGNYIGTNPAGTAALANKVGIEDAGSSNTIGGSVLGARNVISGNTGDGVLLDDTATAENMWGNYIGLKVGGDTVLANGSNGVEVKGSGNTIGGNSGDDFFTHNFISGNGNDGVLIDRGATGNQMQGNFIGMGVSGTNGVGNVANGIEIAGSSNTVNGTVSGNKNVISGNGNNGVLIDHTAANNLIQGNYVGTDYTGQAVVANCGNGIEIQGTGNTVGGTATGSRNIISGNSSDGVRIDGSASGTLVQGNYIGLNALGAALGNGGNGVNMAGFNNSVGGTASGARNIISGNRQDGVLLASGGSGHQVLGNYIGTNAAGTAALSNSIGIEVAGSSNTVGGSASGSRNLISGNRNDGVRIDYDGRGNLVLGNAIGVNTYDSAVLGNSGNGIEVVGSNNTLGASYAVAPNEISGNSNDGVLLASGSSGNQVLGNYIGTNHSGTAAMANKVGIEDGGSSNTIGGSVLGARNVISGNTGDGVLLDGTATAETMQGNYIGVNVGGNTILANGSNGVEVQGTGNTIGGNSGADYFVRNFISGNGEDGVLLDGNGSGNQVLGNFIGVGVSGTNGVGNVANAIEIAGSSNTIGGAASSYRNVISGSGNDGVLVGNTANNNILQGNFVGTDYTGTSAVANSGDGIEIQGTGNTVGGTILGAGNVISGNSKNGVLVSGGSDNTISRNSIFANAGLGISLTSGANNSIAAPSLSLATISGSTLEVTGTFTATTTNSYVLEFFANASGDAEGKIYLGSLTVTPTSTGTQSFTFSTTTTVTGANPLITATLIDDTGDTSEFSAGVTVS